MNALDACEEIIAIREVLCHVRADLFPVANKHRSKDLDLALCSIIIAQLELGKAVEHLTRFQP